MTIPPQPSGHFLTSRRGLFPVVLALGIDLLLSGGLQAQGVVRPSTFHPLSFPGDTQSSADRSLALHWLDTPPPVAPDEHMGVSAFVDPLAPPPPSPDISTPIPVTRTDPGQPTNFRIGPLKLRAATGLGVEFSDNIEASSTDRKSELILTPSAQITGHWAVSSLNDFSVTLGLGYDFHLFHPELGTGLSLQIVPGTDFNFKIKVGELSFVLYDRPSLQQAPFDDPTRPSGIFYQDFENSAGLTVFWSLANFGVQFGYSHVDSIPLESDSSSSGKQNQANDFDLQSLRRTVDSLSSSVTFRLRDDLSAGLDGAISSVRYPSGRDDGITSNLGVFLDKQFTNYTAARLSVGYQKMDFGSGSSGGGSNSSSGDSSGFYGSLAIRNRLNRLVFNTFSVGQEADVSYTSNSDVTDYIRDEITLRLIRGVSLNAFASYQYVEQSGDHGQTFTLLSLGFNASHAFSPKLSGSLGYTFVSRQGSGNEPAGHENSSGGLGTAGEYTENRITLNLSYAF